MPKIAKDATPWMTLVSADFSPADKARYDAYVASRKQTAALRDEFETGYAADARKKQIAVLDPEQPIKQGNLITGYEQRPMKRSEDLAFNHKYGVSALLVPLGGKQAGPQSTSTRFVLKK